MTKKLVFSRALPAILLAVLLALLLAGNAGAQYHEVDGPVINGIPVTLPSTTIVRVNTGGSFVNRNPIAGIILNGGPATNEAGSRVEGLVYVPQSTFTNHGYVEQGEISGGVIHNSNTGHFDTLIFRDGRFNGAAGSIRTLNVAGQLNDSSNFGNVARLELATDIGSLTFGNGVARVNDSIDINVSEYVANHHGGNITEATLDSGKFYNNGIVGTVNAYGGTLTNGINNGVGEITRLNIYGGEARNGSSVGTSWIGEANISGGNLNNGHQGNRGTIDEATVSLNGTLNNGRTGSIGTLRR